MLFQTLAAFLALIVFASQGAMAAPLHPRSSDDLLTTTGTVVGDLGADTLPAEFNKSAIQASTGDVVTGDGHRDGATDEVVEAGGSVVGSGGTDVLPPEFVHAGVKAADDYYGSK